MIEVLQSKATNEYAMLDTTATGTNAKAVRFMSAAPTVATEMQSENGIRLNLTKSDNEAADRALGVAEVAEASLSPADVGVDRVLPGGDPGRRGIQTEVREFAEAETCRARSGRRMRRIPSPRPCGRPFRCRLGPDNSTSCWGSDR